MFEKSGIKIPRGFDIRREGITYTNNVDKNIEGGDGALPRLYKELGVKDVVVKAQVLSGKRGKNNGIRFCSSLEEVNRAVDDLFSMEIQGQYVAAVRVEEKLDILEEHYLSITYDTNAKVPIVIYSAEGGVDIEDVEDEKIVKEKLKIEDLKLKIDESKIDIDFDIVQNLWECFLENDCRVVEINPLVKTGSGEWIAADAKIAIDDDAAFRHEEWGGFESRTMMGRKPTEREIAVQEIDKGEKYYQGTAGKYIEMDGDIAILFSGGGASIANMDALISEGLKPANYTEYSGNPPREKVYQLAKIVLSKPGLKGLWIAGGVANFTNVKETFNGIVDALDEIKPNYPIVVRRAGPYEEEGMEMMQECGERNGLNMKLFGKEMAMSDTAKVLAGMVGGFVR